MFESSQNSKQIYRNRNKYLLAFIFLSFFLYSTAGHPSINNHCQHSNWDLGIWEINNECHLIFEIGLALRTFKLKLKSHFIINTHRLSSKKDFICMQSVLMRGLRFLWYIQHAMCVNKQQQLEKLYRDW